MRLEMSYPLVETGLTVRLDHTTQAEMTNLPNSSNTEIAALEAEVQALRQELVQKNREHLQARRQVEVFALDLKKILDSERRSSAELRMAYFETVRRLMRVARIRDQETGAHLDRIAAYVRLLASRLDLTDSDIETISMASSLHDIGKIGISDSILLKAGPLDSEERREVEKHAKIGASMLEDSPSPLLGIASEIALTHHENWDGSGYPYGLKGEKIPLSGRLVRIADQYDALRSERIYKKPFSHEESREIILNGDGRTDPAHFDPIILQLFGELHVDFEAIAARMDS